LSPKRLLELLVVPKLEHRPRGTRKAIQRQHRLDAVQVAELVTAYRAGAGVKELAVRFDVHRETVAATVRRAGIKPRRRGLTAVQISQVSRLYAEGWSLARLGERFGVDGMTVRLALLKEGVVMRAPHERPRSA
jgi:DNA-binding CsgD family transcriptional regulator